MLAFSSVSAHVGSLPGAVRRKRAEFVRATWKDQLWRRSPLQRAPTLREMISLVREKFGRAMGPSMMVNLRRQAIAELKAAGLPIAISRARPKAKPSKARASRSTHVFVDARSADQPRGDKSWIVLTGEDLRLWYGHGPTCQDYRRRERQAAVRLARRNNCTVDIVAGGRRGTRLFRVETQVKPADHAGVPFSTPTG